MKIYDCFIFNDELMLLNLRLHELYDSVDYFVIVESTKTFTQKKKPLHFNDNKEQFLRFQDKIIHIVVDDAPREEDDWAKAYFQRNFISRKFLNCDEPQAGEAWRQEYFQRNAICRGLTNCQGDDIIILSDLDEIPDKTKFNQINPKKYNIFMMRLFYFFFNCEMVLSDAWLKKLTKRKSICTYNAWRGTTATSFRLLKSAQHLRLMKPRLYPWWRFDRIHPHCIRDGGWHFSNLMDVKGLQSKISSYAHTEQNTPEITNEKALKARIRSAVLGTEEGSSNAVKRYASRVVEIDSSFPQYLLSHRNLFREYILDDKKIEEFKLEQAPKNN